jgi:tetratricopeptide (TPR) repeat protein
MLKDGELSINGKWIYATVYHQMMYFCKKEAIKWYDAVLADDEDKDLHPYRRAASMKMGLLFYLGKGEEVIKEQEAKFDAADKPLEPREWVLLIDAYSLNEQHEKSYEAYRRAIDIYPENWELYISGGYTCVDLKKYDEAFACFKKAGEIGTPYCDEKVGMTWYYRQRGEYQKAYDTRLEIAAIYRQKGLDFEAEIELESAKELKKEMENKS